MWMHLLIFSSWFLFVITDENPRAAPEPRLRIRTYSTPLMETKQEEALSFGLGGLIQCLNSCDVMFIVVRFSKSYGDI